LPPFASPRNPLDAWGLSWDPARFADLIAALHDDPAIGTIVPAIDAPASGGGDSDFARDMAMLFAKLAPHTPKRFILFNNAAAGGTDAELLRMSAEAGIPCLVGMSPALAAIAHWTNYRGPQADDHADDKHDASARLRRLSETDLESERSRFQFLRDVGIPMVECQVVASASAATEHADRLGYPVVLKGSAPGVAHKTDLGLVRLNLANPKAVESAFADIQSTLRRAGHGTHEITIQPQVTGGVELLVGVRNDPDFGPITVVGLGGTNVELLRQVSIRLGPVDAETARGMFAETLAGKLLAGVRGQAPSDEPAAAAAVAAISRFGASLNGQLAAIEINPLIVLVAGRGAVGVDALLEGLSQKSKEPGMQVKD
jgi:acyl-CoA synthetase (NDP forming)